MGDEFKYLLGDLIKKIRINTNRTVSGIEHKIADYNALNVNHKHRKLVNKIGGPFLYSDYLVDLISGVYLEDDEIRKTKSTIQQIVRMNATAENLSITATVACLKRGGVVPVTSLGRVYYDTDKSAAILALKQKLRESNPEKVKVKRETITAMHKAGTKIADIAKELDLEYQDVYRHIKSPTLKTPLLRHPTKKIAQMKKRMNTMNPFFLMAKRSV